MGFNEKLIYIVIIISLVFTTFSSLIFTTGTIYSVQTDPDYEDIFDNYAETVNTVDTSQQIIQGGDVNPEGQAQAVYPNSISLGKQLVTSSNLFVKFVNEIPKIILIPSIILTMLISLISFLSLFAFIKYLNDRTP